METSLTYCNCETEIKIDVLDLINNISEEYQKDLIKIKEIKVFLFSNDDIITGKADIIIIEEIETIQGELYKTSVIFDIWVIYSKNDVKGLAINVDKFKNLSIEIRSFLIHHELTHLQLDHGSRSFYVPKCLPNLIGREGAIHVSNMLKYLIHDYEVNYNLVIHVPRLVFKDFKRQIELLKSVKNTINKKNGLDKIFYVLRMIASINSMLIIMNRSDDKDEEISSELLKSEIQLKQIIKQDSIGMPEIEDKWFNEDHFESYENLIELFCTYLEKRI